MVADSQQIHNEIARLYDRYEAILALRDAEKDPAKYRQLDHAQQAAFREWLFAMQKATMCSDEGAYTDDQKLAK
jgi:hypothetical protein